MGLEFYEADLYGIGATTSTGTGMAAKLHLAFRDDDRRINHVYIEIFVPKDQKLTLEDMQKAARANSIALLREALAALERAISPNCKRKAYNPLGPSWRTIPLPRWNRS
jgi:hypothetical protein